MCEDKKNPAAMLPDAFLDEQKEILGDEFEAFLKTYLDIPKKALRLNPQKNIFPSLLDKEGWGLKPVSWCPTGFLYSADSHPGKHLFHEMGLFYIQEASAMAPAELLCVRPGEKVLDLCAAPGGKTTQLAGAMQGRGLLVANEINPQRAAVLSQNVERMGIQNAVVTNLDPQELKDRFPEFFDAILVDAPCSGEGMFRKDPDAAAQWSRAAVDHCAKRQRQILEAAAEMLRPGGRLVYSTCTFSKEENEYCLQGFLQDHEEFCADKTVPECFLGSGISQNAFHPGMHRIWPHIADGEGHFFALLKKAESAAADDKKDDKRQKAKKKERKNACAGMAEAMLFSVMKKESADALIKNKRMEIFGENIYLCPEMMIPLSGLKALRPGLHIGVLKKNRVEPAYALSHAIDMEAAMSVYQMSTAEAEKYFAGESLAAPPDAADGWTLACLDGFAAGWQKKSGASFKNHYPKGLRKMLKTI